MALYTVPISAPSIEVNEAFIFDLTGSRQYEKFIYYGGDVAKVNDGHRLSDLWCAEIFVENVSMSGAKPRRRIFFASIMSYHPNNGLHLNLSKTTWPSHLAARQYSLFRRLNPTAFGIQNYTHAGSDEVAREEK